jgi:large subunit ribosomal protein L29
MKAQDFREMATEELQEKVQDLQRRLFELRSQAATEKLEDTRAARNTRREIARVKTVLREKMAKQETTET